MQKQLQMMMTVNSALPERLLQVMMTVIFVMSDCALTPAWTVTLQVTGISDCSTDFVLQKWLQMIVLQMTHCSADSALQLLLLQMTVLQMTGMSD